MTFELSEEEVKAVDREAEVEARRRERKKLTYIVFG